MHASGRPGTDAARHGPGDRLIAMNAAHAAFRRDLVRLAGTAVPANLGEPRRRESIMNGWRMFKHQLLIHHSAEDRLIWPRLRERLAASAFAMSALDAMDAEHALVGHLITAVDDAFAVPGAAGAAAVIDELVTQLSRHLSHEEIEANPLIGEALSDREWRAVLAELHKLVKSLRVLSVADFVPWLTDGVPGGSPELVAAVLPAPLRPVNRWVWQPRYHRVSRW